MSATWGYPYRREIWATRLAQPSGAPGAPENPGFWQVRTPQSMRFDIDDYKVHTDRLRWDDLDLDSFRAQPLDDETLRTIEYMHDVELHTICYLRDLLVTPAHADPDVTAFLSCWAYEELWHGEALGDVLAAHGRPSGVDRVGPLRNRLGLRDRVRPLRVAARLGCSSASGSWRCT